MYKKFKVLGKVQGVFFRKSTQDKAMELGLKGWVRNESDGSVLAIIQGEEEPLKLMEAWLKVGPPRSQVSELMVLEEGYNLQFVSFEIK
ncbi:acylphosphatase [Echinicola marina]|uniref:acylphosphatase n=1 Tax=Echinicola marina TaxID=2859768 RepID=UPI001CF6B1D4|nr:acylphosphatase [Echinicola marina]UCS94923.1 acylphosphatase [Echinicola marina]